MSSKRRQRRQREREARLRAEVETLKENPMSDQNRQLMGGIGRTGTVAALILQRHKLGENKPSIQVAQPQPGVPLTPPASAASPGSAPATTSVGAPALSANGEDPIISSQKHKEMIWKAALANRELYLKRQREDNNRHPWFFYVEEEGQYSRFVMLNTKMAQEMMDHLWSHEDGNRRQKPWLKEGYKRDIINGDWIPSDEALSIDFNHTVYNGQHRLMALIESGKEWPFYVTFNALEEAKFAVDSGGKRTEGEKMRLVMETPLGNRTTGFCKALMRGLQNRVRFTASEIVEFAHQHEPLLRWVKENLPSGRGEVQAAIAKAYLWYGPELIEPFCKRLREIQFTEEGDPAKALFVALQRAKVNRINNSLVAYKKTLAAIDALVDHKSIGKLYERDEDIFQWDSGWRVPQRPEKK